MPRRAAKVDANQPEIVAEFRRHGCGVQSLAGVGKGFPDLLIWCDGHYLVEVKNRKGKNRLTVDQIEFIDDWPGPVYVVRDRIEAMALVQHWRKGWQIGDPWPGESDA